MYSFSVEVASHLAVRVDGKPMTAVVESRDGVANRVELVRCGCGVVMLAVRTRTVTMQTVHDKHFLPT